MRGGLRIFVTADPEIPVPPRLYGGIERIVDLLVQGLIARGHEVTLFAHPESRTKGELVPLVGRRSTATVDTLANAALIAREAARRRPDVVQSFGRLAYLWTLLPLTTPKVMSYQRTVTPDSIRWSSRLARGSLRFTGCSRRLIEPVAHLGSWRVIYNAVPIDRYRATAAVPSDAPLVFLGRIERIKGPHLAIDVARRANRRLVIAGNVPDEHREYFESQVRPFVDGDAVRYVGPVDDEAKSALLSGAAALLMPVLWDEPFGIVMAEALACGTPVIGLDRGAVGEVVADGVTGRVCADVDGMVSAVADLARIDRTACRRSAETRFSPSTLTTAYESLYRELTAPAMVAASAVPAAAESRPAS